jgi:hypothetical protein
MSAATQVAGTATRIGTCGKHSIPCVEVFFPKLGAQEAFWTRHCSSCDADAALLAQAIHFVEHNQKAEIIRKAHEAIIGRDADISAEASRLIEQSAALYRQELEDLRASYESDVRSGLWEQELADAKSELVDLKIAELKGG